MSNEMDDYQARMIKGFQEFGIPRYMWEHVSDYVLYGRPVGDFLTAVFRNDLFKAVEHADLSNRKAIPGYAMFCFNCVPTIALKEGFDYWRKVGGLEGHLKLQAAGDEKKRMAQEIANEH